jgi:hypothetical protein
MTAAPGMAIRRALGRIRRAGARAGRWRLWIWAVLAAALGVGLGWVPLFGVLGFELATAVALFAAVMGLDVGRAVARVRQRAQQLQEPAAARSYARQMAAATGTAAGLALAVTAIPAAIAALRGLWAPTCDWWFGVATYLAMPVVTAALAAAVGHALGALCGPRRFLGAIVAQLAVVAVVLAALWRFYSEPPVFSYNAILGYFPGNLYDENIQLTWPLVWSRLEDAGWAVALIGLVGFGLDAAEHRVRWRRPGRRLGALVLAVGAAAAAGVLHGFGGALGYAPDAGDLAAVLDGRVETEHFVIHYAHDRDIDAEIAAIAEDHEFRYAQVVAQLGAAPAGKLTSFLFADADQKARWFGARGVEMAKPWRHEIYLEHRAFPHSSLRHEIAHAVASAFGDPLFGVATRHWVFANPGLIEGLAVAIDWPGSYDQPTPHEAVRAMEELGIEPSIGRLLSLEFFSVSSARGYTTAGSFLRFLLDRYGAAKLRGLYQSGGDFAAAYGAPLATLEAEWRAMIGSIVLPPGSSEAQRERFRGLSVFARPCPHAIAARRVQAARALGAGNRPRAVALLREVCDDTPGEPRHRVELAAVLREGTPPERLEAGAIWLSLEADADHVTSSVRVQALERLAREAALREDRRGVAAWIAAAAALPVDANERRQLDAEQFALHHQGAAMAALYSYFFLPGPIDAALFASWAAEREPELGFAHYLLGLQRAGQGKWEASAEELDRALALGVPGILFVRNAARRLAVAAYRSHDRARVERAIAVLGGPDMTTPDHLLAKDWQDRLAFHAMR